MVIIWKILGKINSLFPSEREIRREQKQHQHTTTDYMCIKTLISQENGLFFLQGYEYRNITDRIKLCNIDLSEYLKVI